MLRVYLSYSPADKAYLETLRRWLRPLEQKYHLRVWHIPLPERGEESPYYWDDMLDELEQAHLYLFLTSPNSQKAVHIQTEELPRAHKRQMALGKELVQLYQIVLPGASDREGLRHLPSLGMAKQIDDWKSDLIGYAFLTKEIEAVICELERNWIEEQHRTGIAPVLSPLGKAKAAPATLKPIPGWLGASFLLAIFYMISSLYFKECAPRRYHGIPPNVNLPSNLPERPYMRETPPMLPQCVPPRPE